MKKIYNTKSMVMLTALLIAVLVSIYAVSVFAERGHHGHGGVSEETKSAIHKAFESADYNAYTAAMDQKHEETVLTQDEFAEQAKKIAKKKQISDTFSANDYEAYKTLTEGSMHQLSESAFTKKAQMIAIKQAIKQAAEDKDFTAFTGKVQELKTLLGDEYKSRYDDMTQEEFNTRATKIASTDDRGFNWHGHGACGGHQGKDYKRMGNHRMGADKKTRTDTTTEMDMVETDTAESDTESTQ
ncbi:MAG: hypothetical protein OXB96_02730 [Candidatus Kaiserbacteria bacterium]|nr:hypothetical protein [Candidatus Kaiserbacteria bacterium]